MYKPKYLQITH